MSGKLLMMPKSIGQIWSDLFQGRKIETYDDMFSAFTSDIGKVAENLQPSGYVGEDGGYIPDWHDEEPWSDTQTRIEQMNSIKGR